MGEKPRRRWHERGVGAVKSGHREVLPRPVQQPETLGGEVKPPRRQRRYASPHDCAFFPGNYCLLSFAGCRPVRSFRLPQQLRPATLPGKAGEDLFSSLD